MKISCQSCQAKYTIADEKVLGKIVKIRCKKCGATIVINGNETGAQATTGGSGAEAQSYDYAPAGGATEQWTVNVADGDQRTMTIEEVVGAYKSGVVTDETFCWKDGMGDWLPIREIQELYAAAAAGGATQGGMSPDQTQQEPGAGAYPTPPPQADHDEATAAGYGGYGAAAAAASSNGNGGNGLFGGGASPAPAPAAARRQGGRGGGGADLFSNVAQAGGEDDVMTSAPVGMPQASNDPGKLTGQRNENSVLFSLTALTENAPKEQAPPPMGEGSGLIDIRALSASMGDTGDKGKRSHVDDIMNLGGGGAFSAALNAPVLAPPTMDGGGLDFSGQPRKDNTKMMLIAIIGAGFLIAMAIILVVLLKKPAEPTATLPTATATPDTTATATAAPSATVAVAANDTAAAAATGAAPLPPGQSAPGAGAGGVDTHKGTRHAGGGGGGGVANASSPAPFIPPAPGPAAGGGSGGGGPKSLNDALKASVPGGGDNGGGAAASTGSSAPFDRGAASAALGSISVGSCKKPDGPTGSGHVSITFAPSGSVQSAVVDQPPFAGTAVGGCVAGKFRSAHIPAFAGAAVHVGKSFTID